MVLPKLNRLKVVILGLLLTWAFFTVDVKAALAHYPHDDIFAVEISPNYQQDQTLYINVRGNLFKSDNRGDSWQKLVKGLDHQYELSALDISAHSPKVLYLSSLGDGIFKSDNGGNSWSKVNQGLSTLNIDLVKIAPDSSDLVLAAGTESGLYQTKNGGASWSPVMRDKHKITAIAFAPQQKKQIIIGDQRGNLFYSTDRGDHWQSLTTLKNSGAITTMLFSPDFISDHTMWVGTEQGGILKTVDGGISFSRVNHGISDQTITSLAISPNYQQDQTIFVSTWHQGIFRSTNKGSSWQEYGKGLTKDGQADLANFKRSHFSDLSISPNFSEDRTIFLAGFDGLFKSIDGGRVWQELSTLSANIIVGLDLSPNYHHDSTVAITTYLGGAYISHDAGANWKTINQGLYQDKWFKRIAKSILQDGYVARLFNIEFSPNYGEDRTILAPSWTDFLKSTNEGQNWQKIPLMKKPSPLSRSTKYSMATSPNFASDQTIYLGSMQGKGKDAMLKSTDGGLSFSQVGSINGQAIVYLAISPDFAADNTLYAGVKDGIYQTVDGGKTWQSVSNGMPAMPEESKLAISPNYKIDQTVFAGTAAGLFVTRDRGNKWNKLAITEELNAAYVEAVAISPDYQSDRTLMVSLRGKGLFKTIDGGITFTQVGNGLIDNNHSLANMYGFWPPTTAIKFSPTYSLDRTIYGVSDTNLFKSLDGGEIWRNLPLPKPPGKSLRQLITYYYHRMTAVSLAKFLIAVILGLCSYQIWVGLRLDKKLPLRKVQIKAGGMFTAFMVVLILLSS